MEEFDKPYYMYETKTTIEDRIKLLEKYNIIDEFENTIAQTVFDINEYCFVFPGNKIDFDNYRRYLNYKKEIFQEIKVIHGEYGLLQILNLYLKKKLNF